MTSRDTHDIVEYEQEVETINVQIPVVMAMIEDSEPELFGRGKAKLMESKSYEMSDGVKTVFARMLQITEWHAEEQILFWDELFKEELKL